MKITFPVSIMNQLFELAEQENISPAKLTVQAVTEFINNHKENTTSASARNTTKD